MVPVSFNSVIENYQDDQYTDSNCGDITFVNTGIAPVTVNGGLRLLSNQSFTFGSNVGEINRTQFKFIFDKDPVATKSLMVVKKYYTYNPAKAY